MWRVCIGYQPAAAHARSRMSGYNSGAGATDSGPLWVRSNVERLVLTVKGSIMPTRTKAADRVKNADERWDGWVKPPYWDEVVETAFQDAIASGPLPDPWAMVLRFLSEGLGVGIREYQEAYCCTLRDSARADDGKTSQLSGWGENPHDALLVVDYKHRIQLDCDWDTAPEKLQQRKRR